MRLFRAAYVTLAVALAGCAPSRAPDLTVTDDTRVRLAEALEVSGDHVNAAEALRGPEARELAQTANPLAHAELLIAVGQADKGMAVAKAALARRGDDVPFALDVARLAVRSDRLAEAAELYQRILFRHSDNLPALNGKAVVLAQQGDLAAAAATLRQALTRSPRDVSSRSNLAVVMLLSGSNTTALHMLEELDQTSPSPQIKANLLMARHRLAVAAQ